MLSSDKIAKSLSHTEAYFIFSDVRLEHDRVGKRIYSDIVWNGSVYQAWDKHIVCSRDTGSLP